MVSLNRYEFVAACEGLLATSPGCAHAKEDLHSLFDFLQSNGVNKGTNDSILAKDFDRLLQVGRKHLIPNWEDVVGKKDSAGISSGIASSGIASSGIINGGGGVSFPPRTTIVVSEHSPLPRLRMWLLTHSWIMFDLIKHLGEGGGTATTSAESILLTKEQLSNRLSIIPTLSRIARDELFRTLCIQIGATQGNSCSDNHNSDVNPVNNVGANGANPYSSSVSASSISSSPCKKMVRVSDLIEVLLESSDYRRALQQRVFRVLLREIKEPKLLLEKFREYDTKKTGFLTKQEIADSILSSSKYATDSYLATQDIRCLCIGSEASESSLPKNGYDVGRGRGVNVVKKTLNTTGGDDVGDDVSAPPRCWEKKDDGLMIHYMNLLELFERERRIYCEHVLSCGIKKMNNNRLLVQQYIADKDLGEKRVEKAQFRALLRYIDPQFSELEDFVDYIFQGMKHNVILPNKINDNMKFPKLDHMLVEIFSNDFDKKYFTTQDLLIRSSATSTYQQLVTSTLSSPRDRINILSPRFLIKPSAPKEHLITLLYYEIYQSLNRNKMSVDQAFDALDVGQKGFLNFGDLTTAIREILQDATVTAADLGIGNGETFKVSLKDFTQLVNFDIDRLEAVFDAVFGTTARFVEDGHHACSTSTSHTVDDEVVPFQKLEKEALKLMSTEQLTNFLKLIYPRGVPAVIDRASIETFLRTQLFTDPTGNNSSSTLRMSTTTAAKNLLTNSQVFGGPLGLMVGNTGITESSRGSGNDILALNRNSSGRALRSSLFLLKSARRKIANQKDFFLNLLKTKARKAYEECSDLEDTSDIGGISISPTGKKNNSTTSPTKKNPSQNYEEEFLTIDEVVEVLTQCGLDELERKEILRWSRRYSDYYLFPEINCEERSSSAFEALHQSNGEINGGINGSPQEENNLATSMTIPPSSSHGQVWTMNVNPAFGTALLQQSVPRGNKRSRSSKVAATRSSKIIKLNKNSTQLGGANATVVAKWGNKKVVSDTDSEDKKDENAKDENAKDETPPCGAVPPIITPHFSDQRKVINAVIESVVEEHDVNLIRLQTLSALLSNYEEHSLQFSIESVDFVNITTASIIDRHLSGGMLPNESVYNTAKFSSEANNITNKVYYSNDRYFLRYYCHGTNYQAQTSVFEGGVGKIPFDFSANHSFGLSPNDKMSNLFSSANAFEMPFHQMITSTIIIECYRETASGQNMKAISSTYYTPLQSVYGNNAFQPVTPSYPVVVGSSPPGSSPPILVGSCCIPVHELCIFLDGVSQAKMSAEALLGANLCKELHILDRRSFGTIGKMSCRLFYKRRKIALTLDSTPVPWKTSFAGKNLISHSEIHDYSSSLVQENNFFGKKTNNSGERMIGGNRGIFNSRREEHSPKDDIRGHDSILMQLHVMKGTIQPEVFRLAAEKWYNLSLKNAYGQSNGHSSSNFGSSLLSISHVGLFVRFCPFPRNVKLQGAGCGWLATRPKPISLASLLLGWKSSDTTTPNVISNGVSSNTTTVVSNTTDLDFEFRWESPFIPPDPSFFEALLLDSAQIELWLTIEKHNDALITNAGNTFEVCLAKNSIPMRSLYDQLDPSKPRKELFVHKKVHFNMQLEPEKSISGGSPATDQKQTTTTEKTTGASGSADTTQKRNIGTAKASSSSRGASPPPKNPPGEKIKSEKTSTTSPAKSSEKIKSDTAESGIQGTSSSLTTSTKYVALAAIELSMTIILPSPDVMSLLYLVGIPGRQNNIRVNTDPHHSGPGGIGVSMIGPGSGMGPGGFLSTGATPSPRQRPSYMGEVEDFTGGTEKKKTGNTLKQNLGAVGGGSNVPSRNVSKDPNVAVSSSGQNGSVTTAQNTSSTGQVVSQVSHIDPVHGAIMPTVGSFVRQVEIGVQEVWFLVGCAPSLEANPNNIHQLGDGSGDIANHYFCEYNLVQTPDAVRRSPPVVISSFVDSDRRWGKLKFHTTHTEVLSQIVEPPEAFFDAAAFHAAQQARLEAAGKQATGNTDTGYLEQLPKIVAKDVTERRKYAVTKARVKLFQMSRKTDPKTFAVENISIPVGEASVDVPTCLGAVTSTVWAPLCCLNAGMVDADMDSSSREASVVEKRRRPRNGEIIGRVLLTTKVSLLTSDFAKEQHMNYRNLLNIPSGLTLPTCAFSAMNDNEALNWIGCTPFPGGRYKRHKELRLTDPLMNYPAEVISHILSKKKPTTGNDMLSVSHSYDRGVIAAQTASGIVAVSNQFAPGNKSFKDIYVEVQEQHEKNAIGTNLLDVLVGVLPGVYLNDIKEYLNSSSRNRNLQQSIKSNFPECFLHEPIPNIKNSEAEEKVGKVDTTTGGMQMGEGDPDDPNVPAAPMTSRSRAAFLAQSLADEDSSEDENAAKQDLLASDKKNTNAAFGCKLDYVVQEANTYAVKAVLFFLALRALAKLVQPCWEHLKQRFFSSSRSLFKNSCGGDLLPWSEFRRFLDFELAQAQQPPLPEGYWLLISKNKAWCSTTSDRFDWLVFFADMSTLISYNQKLHIEKLRQNPTSGKDLSSPSREGSEAGLPGAGLPGGKSFTPSLVHEYPPNAIAHQMVNAGMNMNIIRSSYGYDLAYNLGGGGADFLGGAGFLGGTGLNTLSPNFSPRGIFSPQKSLKGGGQILPLGLAVESTPQSFRLAIHNAIHLPLVKNSSPTVYVESFFAVLNTAVLNTTSVIDGLANPIPKLQRVSRIYKTPTIAQSCSPQFNWYIDEIECFPPPETNPAGRKQGVIGHEQPGGMKHEQQGGNQEPPNPGSNSPKQKRPVKRAQYGLNELYLVCKIYCVVLDNAPQNSEAIRGNSATSSSTATLKEKLLGNSTIALSPLVYIPKIDGYYDIESPNAELNLQHAMMNNIGSNGGNITQIRHGQLRVSVSPVKPVILGQYEDLSGGDTLAGVLEGQTLGDFHNPFRTRNNQLAESLVFQANALANLGIKGNNLVSTPQTDPILYQSLADLASLEAKLQQNLTSLEEQMAVIQKRQTRRAESGVLNLDAGNTTTGSVGDNVSPSHKAEKQLAKSLDNLRSQISNIRIAQAEVRQDLMGNDLSLSQSGVFQQGLLGGQQQEANDIAASKKSSAPKQTEEKKEEKKKTVIADLDYRSPFSFMVHSKPADTTSATSNTGKNNSDTVKSEDTSPTTALKSLHQKNMEDLARIQKMLVGNSNASTTNQPSATSNQPPVPSKDAGASSGSSNAVLNANSGNSPSNFPSAGSSANANVTANAEHTGTSVVAQEQENNVNTLTSCDPLDPTYLQTLTALLDTSQRQAHRAQQQVQQLQQAQQMQQLTTQQMQQLQQLQRLQDLQQVQALERAQLLQGQQGQMGMQGMSAQGVQGGLQPFIQQGGMQPPIEQVGILCQNIESIPTNRGSRQWGTLDRLSPEFRLFSPIPSLNQSVVTQSNDELQQHLVQQQANFSGNPPPSVGDLLETRSPSRQVSPNKINMGTNMGMSPERRDITMSSPTQNPSYQKRSNSNQNPPHQKGPGNLSYSARQIQFQKGIKTNGLSQSLNGSNDEVILSHTVNKIQRHIDVSPVNIQDEEAQRIFAIMTGK